MSGECISYNCLSFNSALIYPKWQCSLSYSTHGKGVNMGRKDRIVHGDLRKRDVKIRLP